MRQVDKWYQLIHHSTSFQDNISLKGEWFYKGFKNSNDYSGTWTLGLGLGSGEKFMIEEEICPESDRNLS